MVETSQCSNLDLKAQTFGAHLGLVRGFAHSKGRSQLKNLGLSWGFGAKPCSEGEGNGLSA